MGMEILSQNEEDTIKAARELASKISPGTPLLLHGKLGAGKSVFARGLIRTLSGDETLEVPSPTFTLVQTYETKAGPLWHFDLYRLEAPEEIYELGWEDALAGGIVIVEWPERLSALKPSSSLDISITQVENEPDQRRIDIRTP